MESMTIADESQKAFLHLSTHDPYLAPIIAKVGPCPIQPHKNYYQELVESIISQQLSVKAAATILKRFIGLFGAFPTPEGILESSNDELRSAGLSGQKVSYVRDLAQRVISHEIQFEHLDELSNEEIIAELTRVKGIGEWTVHMFLIFCMGRTDVLAYGDLGVRAGIKKLYKLDELPTRGEVVQVAEKYSWAPYQSIACWYVWKSLDAAPKL